MRLKRICNTFLITCEFRLQSQLVSLCVLLLGGKDTLFFIIFRPFSHLIVLLLGGGGFLSRDFQKELPVFLCQPSLLAKISPLFIDTTAAIDFDFAIWS